MREDVRLRDEMSSLQRLAEGVDHFEARIPEITGVPCHHPQLVVQRSRGKKTVNGGHRPSRFGRKRGLILGRYKPGQDPAHDADQNGAEHCTPEAIDVETLDNGRHQPEHQSVNDQ
jgi:hypothetical protein